MNRTFKILALVLAMAMVFGIFSGCAETEVPEPESTESNAAETETIAPEASAEPAATEEVVGDAEKKLVLYSPATDALNNILISLFEEKYGIEVEVINGSTGELLARADAEKAAPYGDVMLGGGESSFTQYRDVFADYVSPNDENVIEKFRNTTGWCTNYYLAASVLIYNTNLIGDIEVNGYADLLNPELKGKIASADAAQSSSAFMHLETILTDFGGFEADEAWTYVHDLLSNLEGKLQSGSSAVWKSVSDGEMVVGLTYEEAAISLVTSGAPVEIVYPQEGALVDSTVVAIIANSPHPENAKLFIDFLLSQEVQQVICTDINLRPVRDDIEYPEYFTPNTDIVSIDLDQQYVNEHKEDIVAKYTEVFQDVFPG